MSIASIRRTWRRPVLKGRKLRPYRTRAQQTRRHLYDNSGRMPILPSVRFAALSPSIVGLLSTLCGRRSPSAIGWQELPLLAVIFPMSGR